MGIRFEAYGLALILWACGDDVSPHEGAAPPPDPALPDAQTGKTLTLPLIPVATASIYGVPLLMDGKIVMDTPVVLAVGDGYPTEFVGNVRGPYYSGCGPLKGTITYRRIERGSNVIAATLTESSDVRIAVSGEGQAQVIVFGDYQPAADEPCTELPKTGSVPFEARLSVFAWRPVGVSWQLREGCSPATNVPVANASEGPIGVQLKNAAGMEFRADNASRERQLTLTLEADAERSWYLPTDTAGLSELRWPNVASKVTIRPAVGTALSVDVVDVSALTALSASFVLAGFASNSIELTPGSTHGEDGWRRVGNRIVPVIERASVGTGPLCSAPNDTWFDLVSDTPARCDTRPLASPITAGILVPEEALPLSSYVLADGTCALRLRALGANKGKGLEQTFETTLLNVSQLGVYD